MDATSPKPALADRLRDVIVNLRGELDYSRHLFRSGASYVVRDPITFCTHRFSPQDYRILNELDKDKTLGEIFRQLVERGTLTRDDEEGYYEFILDLHHRRLLSLPLSDAARLYRQYEQRRRAKLISQALGFLFLRIPVLNPDNFLSRTIWATRWLFTIPAFVMWIALMSFSGFIIATRFEDLAEPAMTTFTGPNVFGLIVILIGLKVVHEYGHAYACKAFGGHVPEMGVYLVLFTPLAYVDATDSWSFTNMRRRAIVTLGGMYTETIIGGLALVVWAMTEPSPVNTVALQVFMLATVTTVLFNLNPLLRYDGYYLVSDALGIPNLRDRALNAVRLTLKRNLYGLKKDQNGNSTRKHPLLIGFGLATVAFRCLIMAAITTALMYKFAEIGFLIASVLLVAMVGKSLMALANYLNSSEELVGRRVRAVVTTVGLFGLNIFVGFIIPLPIPLDLKGVTSYQNVTTIRTPIDSVVASLPVSSGDELDENELLVHLVNPHISAAKDVAIATQAKHRLETKMMSTLSPAAALQAKITEQWAAKSVVHATAELENLRITADEKLRVLDVYAQAEGQHLAQGEPILRVASGDAEAIFLLRPDEYQALRAQVGDQIICRSPAYPGQDIIATVTYISKEGKLDFLDGHQEVAKIASVPVDTNTGQAASPYFEVRLAFTVNQADFANTTLYARFRAEHITTAKLIERRLKRFINRVREGLST